MNPDREVFSSLLALLLFAVGLLAAHAADGIPSPNTDGFALLIGVNEYAQPNNPLYAVSALKGPDNDVLLMRKLLVREGFKDDPDHILTLIGKSASHSGIIDAIRRQLVEKAKASPGAKIVLYFSGHGSQAYDKIGVTGTGFHQTLVAYDSRKEGGSDILDDELNVQLQELQKYTDKITMIFDSCHSGSVWKDASTLVAKNLPPNPFSSNVRNEKSITSKDVVGIIRPMGGNYSIIVAAMAHETAVEDLVPTETGLQYHGLLTYYLDKVVQSSGDLTYDQIARQAAAAISSRAPSQHPEAEGDINRIFLGHKENRVLPYIHVVQLLDKNRFLIDAGEATGLQVGAIVAVYANDAAELVGDKGRIANATVVETSNFTAVAELSGDPVVSMHDDVKIRIVTPFPANKGMAVYLPSISAIGRAENQKGSAFISKLGDLLRANTLISVVEDPRRAIVLVRWACQEPLPIVTAETTLVQPSNADCANDYHFFLMLSDQSRTAQSNPVGLFGLRVSADDDPGKLAKAIEKRARQESLRRLQNYTSAIRPLPPATTPLTISLERLAVSPSANGLPNIASLGIEAKGTPPVRLGEYFRFKLTNNTDQTLYVAIAWIGSGGGIGLYTPTNTGEVLLPGKTMTTRPPLQAGPPEGLESYKVIATTKPGVDFRVLEQSGISKDIASSQLQWLLSQTIDSAARDPHPAANLDVGDWVTAQYDVVLVKK